MALWYNVTTKPQYQSAEDLRRKPQHVRGQSEENLRRKPQHVRGRLWE